MDTIDRGLTIKVSTQGLFEDNRGNGKAMVCQGRDLCGKWPLQYQWQATTGLDLVRAKGSSDER
jgi:hypothetical protein